MSRATSTAISENGTSYAGEYVGTQTHLLDIPSELAALVRAVQHNDARVTEVRTVLPDSGLQLSPLVAKVLIDHAARTGVQLRYAIMDPAGAVLFETSDVRTMLPWYESPGSVLASVAARPLSSPKIQIDTSTDAITQLRAHAIEACTRNFPTRDGASGYGAAVLTSGGALYVSGQYSGFEKRLGVHAEMGALLAANMDGARDITHIGIASTKFPDRPCAPCGCCRQFIAEMAATHGFSPTVHLFASENDQRSSFTLEELLPVQWTNRK